MLVRSKLSFVYTIAGFFLYPGMNEFSQVDGEKIEKSPSFKEKQKEGLLEIIEVDSAKKDAVLEDDENVKPIVATILSADASDAVELIEELFLIDELRTILEKETARKPKRKKVIDAAQKQLDKLTEDRKKDEDNKPE